MQNQTEPYLSAEDVARELGWRTRRVYGLLDTKVLSGEKQNGRWRIPLSKFNEFKSKYKNTSQIGFVIADSGLLQVSIGLSAVATAIMTLVPNTLDPGIMRGLVYVGALVVNFISLYSSLWLLAEYAQDIQGLQVSKWEDLIGFGHIVALLTTPRMGPYWLMAVVLTLLFIMLVVVGFLMAF
jgi:hypothetical protein